MHMADALISPAVGGLMWGATAVTTVYCARKVRQEIDEAAVPLMGVTGAFIFAAQMLNFSIPGTGSSGHLGGGLILAALLGPHAAFLVMLSVLVVQALFFADGGLLALGASSFNLGFFPAFVAFPFIYRAIVGNKPTPRRVLVGSVAGAVVGLQLGAFGVVAQTTLSGVSELPFTAFMLMMQPIHLAIGVVEGLITAGVITFVLRTQPDILSRVTSGRPFAGAVARPVLTVLLGAALVSGTTLAWFASADPDGLDWAIEQVAGTTEITGAAADPHEAAAGVQARTSFMPDYGFPTAGEGDGENAWPAVDAGTSTAGIVGGVITLGVTALIGLMLRRRPRGRSQPAPDTF